MGGEVGDLGSGFLETKVWMNFERRRTIAEVFI
jgi:hypothetical protein